MSGSHFVLYIKEGEVSIMKSHLEIDEGDDFLYSVISEHPSQSSPFGHILIGGTTNIMVFLCLLYLLKNLSCLSFSVLWGGGGE